MAENPIEDLTESACLELLRDHHFGRVAFVEQADGPPVVTPVNYLLHRGAVVSNRPEQQAGPCGALEQGCVRDRRN
jgi:nitroimidazol reductase NimA-like FMN-containing flavoprotein (pyridoxamine 5'-phosphate oxidase superfamily)